MATKKDQSADRPLITLKRCSIILDDRSALDDVNFRLRAGARWMLVGPNGSGKTLLLKLLRGDMWRTPTGQEQREYFSKVRRASGRFAQKSALRAWGLSLKTSMYVSNGITPLRKL